MVESAVSSTAAEGMLQTAMPNENKQSSLLNQSSGWKRSDEVSLFIISNKRCDGESSTIQTKANEVFALRVRNIWVREGGKKWLFLSWFWLEAQTFINLILGKKAWISIILRHHRSTEKLKSEHCGVIWPKTASLLSEFTKCVSHSLSRSPPVEQFCYFQGTETLLYYLAYSPTQHKNFHYQHSSTSACPSSPLMSSSHSVSQRNSAAVSRQQKIARACSINGPFSSLRERPSHLRRLFQAW